MDPHVLHNIGYGMYIVSSFSGEKLNGQIVNTAFQITSDPVAIAVSINKKNLTHGYIDSSGRFSVSILEEETPLSLIGTFGFKSGRTVDKFAGIKFERLASGCPVVLEHAVGYLEASVKDRFDCGTHTLFLGVMEGSSMVRRAKPMTYDYYHQVKKGTTPENAPTFIRGEGAKRTAATSAKYRCVVCNYIYDPAAGDPDNGIQPGTPFEKLPEKWVCPICGAGKEEFTQEGCAI